MSILSNAEIEAHVKRGFDQMCPDDDAAEMLWNQPVQMATGEEWYLDPKPKKSGRFSRSNHFTKTMGILSTAAAVMVLCTAVYLYRTFAVAATVYLDADSRIEFQTNARNQVLSVRGCNAEGEKIIRGMNLKHADIDTAINAVLGSMMRHGYLEDHRQMVSVTVDGKSDKHTEELSVQLQEHVDEELNQMFEQRSNGSYNGSGSQNSTYVKPGTRKPAAGKPNSSKVEQPEENEAKKPEGNETSESGKNEEASEIEKEAAEADREAAEKDAERQEEANEADEEANEEAAEAEE